jgi:hypothetical protein
MFYGETQSFLNFLRILNRLEVGVFARAVKLDSPSTFPQARVQKSPIFSHPQLPRQPDLHLQNIIDKQYNIVIKQKLPR